MSAIPAQQRPQYQEGEFGIEELFFSHTDKKGTIQSGNNVFLRVSGYHETELLGKPHNVIRSPLMPRAVFKLFWSYLQSQKSIVAYVVNKSKNDKPYWVLALAFPWNNGYLSIRLRPSSTVLENVQNLYNRVLAIESTATPEKSLAFLDGEIKTLGFADYDAFMIHALQSELISRSTLIKNQSKKNARLNACDARPAIVEQMHDIVKNLEKLAHKVQTEFKPLNHLCVNLSVYAEKYGSAGATTSVISETFGKWGQDSVKVIGAFIDKQIEFQNCLRESRMAIAFASLQTEMAHIFANTAGSSQLYIDGLNSLAIQNQEKVSRSLQTLSALFAAFETSVQVMKESMLAMRIIRLSSRIESSHLPDEGKMINSIVENVGTFVSGIEKQINEIDQAASQSRRYLSDLAA